MAKGGEVFNEEKIRESCLEDFWAIHCTQLSASEGLGVTRSQLTEQG